MLRFEETQVKSLETSQFDRFVLETVAHLRTRLPEACEGKDDAELDGLVRAAHRDGKGWKVTSAYDVRRLSECYLLYGTDFGRTDETGWARRILRRDDLDGRRKMTAISQQEAFETGGGA